MICEICEKEFDKHLIERHHIKSKCYGGSDSEYNIANLCPIHHKMVHRNLIILEGKFDSTRGPILVWRKHNEESITGFNPPKVFIIKDLSKGF